MTMTSWGLLLSLVGAAVLFFGGIRLGTNKDGYAAFVGSRWWESIGWLLIITGFVLQFQDSRGDALSGMGRIVRWDVALTVAGTLAVAVFAAVELALARRRERAEKALQLRRARGQAWLARRTLQVFLEEAAHSAMDPTYWIRRLLTHAERLDRLESQLLHTLNAADIAGDQYREAAEGAFADFLAMADMAARPPAVRATAVDRFSRPEPTEADLRPLMAHAEQIVARIESAIVSLEVIAPRQSVEPRPPAIRRYYADKLSKSVGE